MSKGKQFIEASKAASLAINSLRQSLLRSSNAAAIFKPARTASTMPQATQPTQRALRNPFAQPQTPLSLAQKFATTTAPDAAQPQTRGYFAKTKHLSKQAPREKLIETAIVFAGFRILHKGLLETIREAREISQKVAIIYPTNPNPNNYNPFSDTQKVTMIKMVASEQNLDNLVLVGIPQQVWNNLQQSDKSAESLRWITQYLDENGLGNSVVVRGPNRESREHQIYPQLEGEIEVRIHPKKINFVGTSEEVNSTAVLSNLFSANLEAKATAVDAIPQSLFELISQIAEIARIKSKEAGLDSTLPLSSVTEGDYRKHIQKAWQNLQSLAKEDAPLKKRLEILPSLGAIESRADLEDHSMFTDGTSAILRPAEEVIEITPINPKEVTIAEPKKPESLGLFLGRFQAFHKGHESIVKDMLKQNDIAVVIIASDDVPSATKPGSFDHISSAKTPHSFEQVKSFIEAAFEEEVKAGRLKIINRNTDLGNSSNPEDWKNLAKKFGFEEKRNEGTIKGVKIYAGNKLADIKDGEHYIAKVAKHAGIDLVLVAPTQYNLTTGSVDEKSKNLSGADASAYGITVNPTSQMAMQLTNPKIMDLMYRNWICANVMDCAIGEVTKEDLQKNAKKIDDKIAELNKKGLAVRPAVDGEFAVIFAKEKFVTKTDAPTPDATPSSSSGSKFGGEKPLHHK